MKLHLTSPNTEPTTPGVTISLFDDLISLCQIRISEFMEWLLNDRDIKHQDIKDYGLSCSRRFVNEDFRILFLSESEIMRLNSFRTLKKQIEWMCGRFAAKILAIESIRKNHFDLSFIFLPEIRVMTTDKGAPYLPDLYRSSVSISHSHDYAIAALISQPGFKIGVDIEKIAPMNTDHFLKLAFSERERKLLENSDDRTLTTNWSMKEAILKLMGQGFHQPLTHTEIIGESVYIDGLRQEKIIQKRMIVDDEFVLSIAYEQIKNHRAVCKFCKAPGKPDMNYCSNKEKIQEKNI
ncbi:4'-phosphopantetheinyl transferase family protein [Desulforegula conservatrix]|uniref:4'-phosphopantetheinyl transferase family protein n=1 Tax=Desulforegula conservatrix TaxID=153026 RepID=UPI0003F7EDF3|nr:4'-phosphopantetheinyl transferase superfamily protein [Desulforegula conservatrix]